jgi:hypothetical protein
MEQKPLILEIEEAKAELVQAVNNAIQVHKLPCYMVDLILQGIVAQVKEGARQELEMAKEQIKTE